MGYRSSCLPSTLSRDAARDICICLARLKSQNLREHPLWKVEILLFLRAINSYSPRCRNCASVLEDEMPLLPWIICPTKKKYISSQPISIFYVSVHFENLMMYTQNCVVRQFVVTV